MYNMSNVKKSNRWTINEDHKNSPVPLQQMLGHLDNIYARIIE